MNGYLVTPWPHAFLIFSFFLSSISHQHALALYCVLAMQLCLVVPKCTHSTPRRTAGKSNSTQLLRMPSLVYSPNHPVSCCSAPNAVSTHTSHNNKLCFFSPVKDEKESKDKEAPVSRFNFHSFSVSTIK